MGLPEATHEDVEKAIFELERRERCEDGSGDDE